MLQIAKIIKSNGTGGDVLMGLYDISVQDFDLKEPLFIEFDGLPVPFFIESITAKGISKAIVHLSGVDCLEDAEEIVGRAVWLDAEEEEEDSEDFIGWTLLDKGRIVGTVTGIEPIPGNLCLIVGDTLVPLHEDLVLSADPEKRILDLDLPEGLF